MTALPGGGFAFLGPGIGSAVRESNTKKRAGGERRDGLSGGSRRFRALLEASAAAVCLLDAKGAIVWASPSASRLLAGEAEAELAGRPLADFVAPADRPAVAALLGELAREPGAGRQSEFRCTGPDPRTLGAIWRAQFGEPELSGIVATFSDLTDFKRAIAMQSALYRIVGEATAIGEMRDFYASVHRILGRLLDAKNFYIAMYDAEADEITFPYFVDEGDASPQPMKPGKSLTAIVLRTGQPLFVTEETFNEMAARGEVDLVGAPSADWLGVPLRVAGETVGVLAVQSYVPTRRYVEWEKLILTFVAQHVSVGLEKKRALEALRVSEERYRQLFERNLAGVFRSTIDGRLLDCNNAFVRIYGYDSREELLAIDTHTLYPSRGDRDAFVERILATGSAVNVEVRARKKDGTPVWVLENVNLVKGLPGRPPLLEGTLVDITDRKNAEAQIAHLAFHDALTGLPNRALFDDRLALALARCRRDGARLAVLFVDLDRFKAINDSLGHHAGDRLLKAVAERLRSCVREEDTIARVGGDEFVVLLAGIAQRADAETVAAKVLRAIADEPFTVGKASPRVTASIGVSLYPEHGAEPESLIRSADDAMYGVKAAGRNGCALAAPEA